MISKRVLFIAVAVLLASTAGAWAASVNVDNFNVATLDIVGASDYLNLKSAASWGVVGGTVTTPVPTPFSTIQLYVANGYAGTAWTGTGGINSSVAATDPNMMTAIGIIPGSDAIDWLGIATFHGHTVAADDSLLRYTYYGDSDFSGGVDDDDYYWFDLGYNDPSTPRTWAFGDYDYNGTVDDDDYYWFDLVYNTSGLPNLGGYAAAASSRPGPTAVPEPSTMALLVLAGFAGLFVKRFK
jgi:hypothetical protein